MADDAKSKRDLIWEQKRKQREERLRNGGGQEAPSSNQPPTFAKKPLFGDNSDSGPFQPAQPLGTHDTNKARNVPFPSEPEFPKPTNQLNNDPFQGRNDANDHPPNGMNHGPPSQSNMQPKFSEYEPVVNRNKAQPDFRGQPPEEKKLNFNPSFQPTGGDAYEPPVRQSREGPSNDRMDERKRKAAYAEDLRSQMKQHEVQKQQEKHDVRSSGQMNNMSDDPHKEVDKRRKEQYGDFLKQQMKDKQDSKAQDMDRKGKLIQSLEGQDYNPFGRGGGGAPARGQGFGQNNYQQPNNFASQKQFTPQQQYFPPQGGGNPYQQPPTPQQQGYPPQQNDYNQQNDKFQPQRGPPPQQQAYYNSPASGQSGSRLNNYPPPPQQDSYIAQDRFGSVEPPQRSNSRENNVLGYNQGDNRGGAPNIERGRGRNLPLQSEDPHNVAMKDKAKQDYQKELRDQIEAKKRAKEQEKQRQKEEDRAEEERIRKEQEDLARKEAEENPKKKQGKQAPEPDNFVQQPPDRRNRNASSNQALSTQNSVPTREAYGFQEPPPPPQQQQPQHQPPYQQYQQPPPSFPPYGQPYTPPYNPQYNQPFNPPPYNYPYPQYPPVQPYGQPFPPPGGFLPPPRNEFGSEISQIRTEIQNQQLVLSKQLESIKKEALTAMDERNRAEQELLQLREKLKDKIDSEEAYKKNLRVALEKHSTPQTGKTPEIRTRSFFGEPTMPSSDSANQELPVKRRPPKSEYDNPYERAQEKIPMNNKGYNNIRQSNQNMNDPMKFHNRLEDLQSPFLDGDKTLAGVTKLIPLEEFDNRRSLEEHHDFEDMNNDLSKMQNYNKRPPSGRKFKEDDSLDVLIKAHGSLRPGTSDSNDVNATHLIGKRLEETDALLNNYGFSAGGNFSDNGRLKSRENDTLSRAARNIIGDNPSRGMDMLSMHGDRNKGASRTGSRGIEEGIRMNNNLDPFADLSPPRHQIASSTEPYDHIADQRSMNTTGMSFNIDRINLANEARLRNLDNGDESPVPSDVVYGNVRGKANYYNNQNHRGGLEAIEEDADADDNFAKIDKMLGGYLKTHEEGSHNKLDMYR